MPSYTNAETKIPKLLLDYVESRRSALGLPVVGTCTERAGESAGGTGTEIRMRSTREIVACW